VRQCVHLSSVLIHAILPSLIQLHKKEVDGDHYDNRTKLDASFILLGVLDVLICWLVVRRTLLGKQLISRK